MKILFINNMGVLHGGAESMLWELRRGLINQGHEVRILAGDERGNGEKIADDYFRSSSRFFYLFNPFAMISLLRVLRTYNPDIVHLHTVSKASPFILTLLKCYPTVLTIHDHTLFDPTRLDTMPSLQPYKKSLGDYFIDDRYSPRFYLEKLRFFFFSKLAKNIDLVLACSDFYSKCARESGFFIKVQTLHNGITLPKLEPITNWENLVFIGRLDEVKGVQILLEAFAEVVKKLPNTSLSIVGGGSLEKQLKRRVEELNISVSVQFFGHLSSLQVVEQYQKTTLVIVPSLYPDNFPTVCIEAMAVGRPVIASKVGGIPELVLDNNTGILVSPNNPQELAEKIIETFGDQENIKRMSDAGVLRARQEFSAEKYITETEKAYLSILK